MEKYFINFYTDGYGDRVRGEWKQATQKKAAELLLRINECEEILKML